MAFQLIGRAMQVSAIAICSIGLLIHLLKWLPTSAPAKWYLFFLLILEVSNVFLLLEGDNVYFLGIAPVVHLLFWSELNRREFPLKDNYRVGLQILVVLLAILLFPFSANASDFQAYSALVFNAIILSLALWCTYQTITHAIGESKPKLFFFYATILFFGIDLFLSISSNYLINAPIHWVIGFWMIRFFFLLLYYYSVIRHSV